MNTELPLSVPYAQATDPSLSETPTLQSTSSFYTTQSSHVTLDSTQQSNSTGIFTPLPLERAKKEVRLLKLARPTSDFWTTPCCTLETFNLWSAPPYIALSYMWGNSHADTKTAQINNKVFCIKPNLYNFLCHFRNDPTNKPTTYLWIDQICINQLGTDERAHQVGLMSEIYSRATYVIAWLGSGAEILASAQAFSSKTSSLQHTALIHVLNNPYFTRLWITQELILARTVCFLCDSIWLCPEEMLAHAIDNSALIMPKVGNASLSLLWDTLKGHGTRLLSECIRGYSQNQCVDLRDKVYGFLGLVYKHQRLRADYDKDTWEVYVDAVEVLAREDVHGLPKIYSLLAGQMGFEYKEVYPRLMKCLQGRARVRACCGSNGIP